MSLQMRKVQTQRVRSVVLTECKKKKKSIHDLKEVYEILARESMHIDFCTSARAVHVHDQVMKAAFCWAWNGNKQMPFLLGHRK